MARERVLVAMSGGVDSSVAALLLHDAGYEVTGATLRLYGNEDIGLHNASACCSLDDIEDARSVAFKLGFSHYVFNFGATFARDVIDRFVSGYLSGETPNPCIDCNRFVKFEALQRRRCELGFDYVATGHYARRCLDEASGRYLLKKGVDAAKDQSYVLYHLTQEHLAHMLFPLGELTKSQVRQRAREAGLETAAKPESQDICFVPRHDYARFIERRTGRPLEPGPIVDESGAVLGRHAGLAAYTVGQRRGIGVAARRPLYVIRKDMARNALVVGPGERLYLPGVEADDVNLISLDRAAVMGAPLRVEAKANYRQPAQPAWALLDGNGVLRVAFDGPLRAPAPGQAVVMYRGDVVVGGATIRRALPLEEAIALRARCAALVPENRRARRTVRP